jgi:hypothetical protein
MDKLTNHKVKMTRDWTMVGLGSLHRRVVLKLEFSSLMLCSMMLIARYSGKASRQTASLLRQRFARE